MKDEIKEILEELKEKNETYKECSENGIIENEYYKSHILLDYINNLQEELEDLREDNYAYHQLMKMQNKREYRSKFLKEFQEEFGTNVFPDYDEIYKRYDKLKKENEELNRMCELYGKSLYNAELTDYKSRIDKAREYINENKHLSMFADCREPEEDWNYDLEINPRDLLNILNGGDKK